MRIFQMMSWRQIAHSSSVVGRPLGAPDDLQHTEQGLRRAPSTSWSSMVNSSAKREEGLDTRHHHGAGDGRDVALQRACAAAGLWPKHTHRHDRVRQDQAGCSGVDRSRSARMLSDDAWSRAARAGIVAEQQGPGIDVGQGVIEHGWQPSRDVR